MTPRSVLRYENWTLQPDREPDAEPVLYVMQCAVDGETSRAHRRTTALHGIRPLTLPSTTAVIKHRSPAKLHLTGLLPAAVTQQSSCDSRERSCASHPR